jgi:hypothetical protein
VWPADPETFLKDLGEMASQMGMSSGGGTPSEEVAKLAQAFKMSDNLKLNPGEHPDAAAMNQAHELLESSPFLKAKVEEAMRDPAQMRKMMEAHPDMRSKMQEAQHLIQQEPEWPQIQRKLQQAQHDPALMAELRAELTQKRDAEVDPATRQKMQHELDGLEEIARVTAAAAAKKKKPAAVAPAAAPAVVAPAPPSAAAAAPPLAQASAAERTPAHSFADAEGGGLVLCVEVPELTSMGAAELEVSGTGFSLYVPQLYRLGPLAWPRPVDVDAARAKFLKKRGVLQVTLPDVCV